MKEFESASSLDLKIIFVLAFLHGMNSSILNEIPFVFKEPNYYCYDPKKDDFLECNSRIACSSETVAFKTDIFFNSITHEFNMICDQSFNKVYMQSFIFVGAFSSTVLAIIFRIPAKYKGKTISILNFISGLFAVLGSLTNNEMLISICFCIFHSTGILFYMIVYSYPPETFKNKKFTKLIPSILTTIWGFFGCFFAIFAYLLKDWRKMNIYFIGIPMMLLSLYFFSLNIQFSEENKKISIPSESSDLKEIEKKTKCQFEFIDFSFLKQENIRKNSLIFCLLFICAGFSYFCLTLSLEIFSENIFWTSFLFGVFEGIFSYLAGLMILKFELISLLKKTVFIISLFFILQVFCPIEGNLFGGLLALFTKAGCEMAFTFDVTLLMKIVPACYHQSLFAICIFLSRLFLVIYPAYMEFMKKINLNPLFLIGLINIIPLFFLNSVKILEGNKESLDEVLIMPMQKIERK